jgi:hypothetical protein
MDQSCDAEVHPKLFEFIEREQTGLSPDSFSTKTGVLLAGEDLLRAAAHFPGSKRPKGWRAEAEGFRRRTEDRRYTLSVFKIGDYWFVMRRTSRSIMAYEYLALAFDQVPLCTRTDQEAMRLADHCYPDPGQTMGGCWVPWVKR